MRIVRMKIYPCVLCNSKIQIKTNAKSWKFTEYYVKCSKCALRGPSFLTKKCAIENYNTYYDSEKAQEEGR